jgi:hypothetical protein
MSLDVPLSDCYANVGLVYYQYKCWSVILSREVYHPTTSEYSSIVYSISTIIWSILD